MFYLKNQPEVYVGVMCENWYLADMDLDEITFVGLKKAFDTVSVITVCSPNGGKCVEAFVRNIRVNSSVRVEDGSMLYNCNVMIVRF